MPKLTHYVPGLQAMLVEMAQSHCRSIDQEATVAVRRYLAEGQDTENLPEELLKHAHHGQKGKPQNVDLPNDLIDKLTASAARHERTPENEMAWAIL
jgi:plasmid stability protein